MPTLLEDKDAIREVIARYSFCFDDARFDDWAAMFTEDAIFEVKGHYMLEGRAAIRELGNTVPKNAKGLPGMKHFMMNQIIDVQGDRATATCYLLLLREGTPLAVDIAGRYEDELVRQDGRWLFAKRTVFFDYHSGE